MDRGSDHNNSRSYGRDLSSSPEPYRKNPPPRRHKRDASQTPSRSPSPYRRRRDDLRRQTPSRSPSPYRHKRNDVRRRSPSPYFRRRDDRPYDARDSRSQYKRKASPPRGDRPDKRRQGDNKRYSPDKQYRGSNNYRDRQRDYSQPPKFDNDRNALRSDRNDKKSLKPISYADNEGPPAVPGFRQSLDMSAQRFQDRSNSSQAQMRYHQGAETEQQSRPSTGQSSDMDMTSPPEEPEEVVVEKAPPKETLEEKKRRWAAIRAANAAKEKENPKDTLLHQAQIGNASENTTPMAASPAGFADSPVSPASPRPGQLDTAPASPDIMLVGKQQVVTDGSSPAADGPSAADYDPTNDMLDDRERAAQKSATAYSETDPNLLSTLPATKIAPVKEEKDFDMFASDYEDEDEDSNEPDNDTKGVVLHEDLLDNWDDKEAYYKIIPRELVKNEQYRIIKFLGRGVFANVVEAEDLHSRNKDARPQEGKTKLQSEGTQPSLVAIKIIRRNDLMRGASLKEMEFVRKVNDADPNDIQHVIRLLDSFDHKGHLCVVFEHMSKNLRDLLKHETNSRGLALPAVRTYARQMFIALKHLQDCQVVHCDLKPDNILVSPDHKTIKICDFGTAVDKRDTMERTEYLVSRFYRAPEIILGFEVGYGIDMWAIGCTLYELWTGSILFMGNNNNQMIKAFIDCLGWPSEKLLKKGDLQTVGNHFEAGPPLKFYSREVDEQGKNYVRKIEQQKKITRDLRTRVHDGARNIIQDRPTDRELNDFADLLGATLNFNVEKRVQAKDALSHKFFPTQTKLLPKAPVIKPPMIKRSGAKFRR